MIYVSTSLVEGFGLPLLESMKYGTPMVLSDIPVYQEVARNSALYFKPNDEKSLYDAIVQVYSSSSLWNELVDSGLRRVYNFDKN